MALQLYPSLRLEVPLPACITVIRRIRQQLASLHFQLKQIDCLYLFADVFAIVVVIGALGAAYRAR
jgi:hypothetical protein